MSVKNLYENDFRAEIAKPKVPVVVDFWAPWCMPCKMMGPVFEELSEEFSGRIAFAKVNTEEEPGLAAVNSIRGIPCLVVFRNGKEIDRVVGLVPKPMLKARLEMLATSSK